MSNLYATTRWAKGDGNTREEDIVMGAEHPRYVYLGRKVNPPRVRVLCQGLGGSCQQPMCYVTSRPDGSIAWECVNCYSRCSISKRGTYTYRFWNRWG